jgi:hypothetical protein
VSLHYEKGGQKVWRGPLEPKDGTILLARFDNFREELLVGSIKVGHREDTCPLLSVVGPGEAAGSDTTGAPVGACCWSALAFFGL